MRKSGAAAIDHGTLLKASLLRTVVATFYDHGRDAQQRLEARMEFEQFLLGAGPRIMRSLQQAFNVNESELARDPAGPDWFMTFASSQASVNT
jgi:hypothetical protein